MREIKIGSYKVGPAFPPFIVAEMSGNHGGSLEKALAIVKAAKEAGAHAVKLQTYTADTITIDKREDEFLITDKNSLWFGRNLYELYDEAHTPWEWHKPISQLCQKLGLIFFSTPFDETAIDFLEDLDVPCYKIASLEITDHGLLKKAAQTGKPLIVSTGGATLEEIQDAVEVVRKAGCKDLILLKCTSGYPAPPHELHLQTLPDLSKRCGVAVGLSDHTLGIGVAIASISFGACLIEKHVTLSRSEGSVDSAFSLEPEELQQLVVESQRAWEAIGQIHYGPTNSEKSSLLLRRSLYFMKDLKKGKQIHLGDIRSIRPAKGLPPKEYDRVIGRTTSKDVKRGDPVSWDVIK
jgi:pseudaminic acid synthase